MQWSSPQLCPGDWLVAWPSSGCQSRDNPSTRKLKNPPSHELVCIHVDCAMFPIWKGIKYPLAATHTNIYFGYFKHNSKVSIFWQNFPWYVNTSNRLTVFPICFNILDLLDRTIKREKQLFHCMSAFGIHHAVKSVGYSFSNYTLTTSLRVYLASWVRLECDLVKNKIQVITFHAPWSIHCKADFIASSLHQNLFYCYYVQQKVAILTTIILKHLLFI